MRQFMRPFTINVPTETTHLGFPGKREPIYEFDGFIDYLNGHFMNANELRSIHPDTTHIVITDYSSEIGSIIEQHPNSRIVDSEGIEYLVRNINNPLKMNHHLEIQLQSGHSSGYRPEESEGDYNGG